MDRCPSHDHLIELLRDIKSEAVETRQDIKNLKDHFNKRHDKAIQTINQNKADIAVLKVKQYGIAAIVGMGGGWAQDILKKIIF